jgi:thiol:disulfide interchange protein
MKSKLIGVGLAALAVMCVLAFVFLPGPQPKITAGVNPDDMTNWLTDLPTALAQAKADKKVVLMDFTGSDWCPGCIELHKKIFSTSEFKNFANSNLVLMEVDFPENKPQPPELEKANKALAQQFKVDGFPVLIVVDGNGKELARDLGTENETMDQFIVDAKKFIENAPKLRPQG